MLSHVIYFKNYFHKIKFSSCAIGTIKSIIIQHFLTYVIQDIQAMINIYEGSQMSL